MSTTSKSLEKAVYAASDSDWDWLQAVQKKLYERSWEKWNGSTWGDYALPSSLLKSMESPVRNERRTPGSGWGRWRPPPATEAWRHLTYFMPIAGSAGSRWPYAAQTKTSRLRI